MIAITSAVKPIVEKSVIGFRDNTFSILTRTFAPPKAETKTFFRGVQLRSARAYSFRSLMSYSAVADSSQASSRSDRKTFRKIQERGLYQCTAAIRKPSSLQRLSFLRICVFSWRMTYFLSASESCDGRRMRGRMIP